MVAFPINFIICFIFLSTIHQDKMKGLLFLCFTFLCFMEYSEAATKTKCEVVRALRNEGVPDTDLRDCKYIIFIIFYFRSKNTCSVVYQTAYKSVYLVSVTLKGLTITLYSILKHVSELWWNNDSPYIRCNIRWKSL